MKFVDLIDEARTLQEFCDGRGWRSCFIGGIAVQRWSSRPMASVSTFLLAAVELRTCSAEDLMVMKLFASRPIDIRDAEEIAMRQEKTLDWEYIEDQLSPLAEAKDEPEILRQFARIRRLGGTR